MHELRAASDEQLLASAADGSRDAFAELVARYDRGLKAVLASSLQDPQRAEDLSQEVWIKIFAALPRFELRGAVRAWIFSVGLNHLRDALRLRDRRARRMAFEGEARVEQLPHAEAALPAERREEQARVQAAIARLDEPFRTALTLVDILGLSYPEAAASLGCRLGTLKSRVHRARLAFRDAYLASGWLPRRAEPSALRETPS